MPTLLLFELGIQMQSFATSNTNICDSEPGCIAGDLSSISRRDKISFNIFYLPVCIVGFTIKWIFVEYVIVYWYCILGNFWSIRTQQFLVISFIICTQPILVLQYNVRNKQITADYRKCLLLGDALLRNWRKILLYYKFVQLTVLVSWIKNADNIVLTI